jgi:DNA repair protein RadC
MRIATAEDAAALLRPFFEGAEEERVVVLHLDAERRVLGITREASGSSDSVDLPVAAIVGSALKLGAAAFVAAHNHPSGDPTPSPGDVEATALLARGAAALGVACVDHLIFANGQFRSFRADGLI